MLSVANRETQIKTPVRYASHPRGGGYKKTETRVTGETVQLLGRLCPDGGNVKWGGHWRNTMGVPKEIKNRITTCPCDPTSGRWPPNPESRDSEPSLFTHVHCSVLRNSYNVEATQGSSVPQDEKGSGGGCGEGCRPSGVYFIPT